MWNREQDNAVHGQAKAKKYTRRKGKNHTYPMDIVLLSKVAIDPVQNVQCSICTAKRQAYKINELVGIV